MENNTNEVVETCSICYEDLTNNTHTLDVAVIVIIVVV